MYKPASFKVHKLLPGKIVFMCLMVIFIAASSVACTNLHMRQDYTPTPTQLFSRTQTPVPTMQPSRTSMPILTVQSPPKMTPSQPVGWGRIHDIAWSSVGDRVAVATSQGIHFHDPETLKENNFWPTPSSVKALVYLEDGALISGEESGSIIIWDRAGKALQQMKNSSSVCEMSRSPNGHWLAVNHCSEKREKSQVSVWDLDTFQFAGNYQSQVFPLAGLVFSPRSDEITLFEQGNGHCTWDIKSRLLRSACQPPICDGFPCGPIKVLSDPLSLRVAFLGPYGIIEEREWDEEKLHLLLQGICDSCRAYDLQYSSKSSYLVVSRDYGAHVLDVASGNVIVHRRIEPLLYIAISPDGKKWVAQSNSGKLLMFETKSGTQIAENANY